MTTLDFSIKRGDSLIQQITVKNDATPPVAIPLTGAIVKYSAKPDADEPNSAGDVIFKTSYDPLQIEIIDAVNGVLLLKLEKADTINYQMEKQCTDPVTFAKVLDHDIEITRQGEPRPAAANAGTIAVAPGSGSIVGTGTAFKLLRVGDYFVPAGATSPNQKPVTIQAIADDTHMTTDYTSWATEAGVVFTAFVGSVSTPMDGELTVTLDTTR